MYPFLVSTESFVVRSYSLMALLAVMAAILTVALRASKQETIKPGVLLLMLFAAIVGGWIASAAAVALGEGASLLTVVRALSPFTRKGLTSTFFYIGACLACAPILIPRGRAALAYLDACAPSIPLGFAFAKLGCFLTGCCAGTLCTLSLAVMFPFGSEAYAMQWKAGLLAPPPALILSEGDGAPRLIGHTQSLRLAQDNPPQYAVHHAQKHGMTFDELVATASESRSLGVWPIQLMYSVAALALWGLAEMLFRKSPFPGSTAALVVTGYGLMRIAGDFLVFGQSKALGLSVPQWYGVLAVVLGLALAGVGRRLPRGGAVEYVPRGRV